MRRFVRLALLALIPAVSAAAQVPCAATALGTAANHVAAVRKSLLSAAVPHADPAVPPVVATQIGQLKDALADAADAAFACASTFLRTEQIEKALADALHANQTTSSGMIETRNGKDVGTYGSDLSVQVLQLFSRPRFVEVDFRFGIECGDDNFLLIFEAASDTDPNGWQERLRWGTAPYTDVGDALGDFVMLTPLTGSYKAPTWRFVVAHGHPACGRIPRSSQFDLDLLSPTADSAKPTVDWHFAHAYTEDHTAPRLATTEDTLDFRLMHEQAPGKTVPPPAPENYRFHLTATGQLEPSPKSEAEGPAGTPADSKPPSATTSSPQ